MCVHDIHLPSERTTTSSMIFAPDDCLGKIVTLVSLPNVIKYTLQERHHVSSLYLQQP